MDGQNTSVIRLFKEEHQTVGGVIARLQYMLDSVWKNSYQAVQNQKQIIEPYSIIKKRLDKILNTISNQNVDETMVSQQEDKLYEYKRYTNLDVIEDHNSPSETEDESTLLGLDLLTESSRGSSITIKKGEGNEFLIFEDDETTSLLLGVDLLSNSSTISEVLAASDWGGAITSDHNLEWNIAADIHNISACDFKLSHNQRYVEVTLQSPFDRILYTGEPGQGRRLNAPKERYVGTTTQAFERRRSERRSSNRMVQLDKRFHRKKLQRSLASYASKMREDYYLCETN